jgi:hypothetical protein
MRIMGIKQLNGGYVPAEDRILLRISTDAGEEFRFWLTRPITTQFLAANRTLAARAAAQKFPPQVAQTVTEFEQQAVAQQTRLDDEFVPGATFPLGEAPVLVVRFALTPVENGVSLDLGMPNGVNVNLKFAHQLAQQVGVLLGRLQTDANWLPAAAPPQNAAAAPADSAADGKKSVH